MSLTASLSKVFALWQNGGVIGVCFLLADKHELYCDVCQETEKISLPTAGSRLTVV